MSKIKTFIVDTNILLDDPSALTNFTNNDVVIPLTTVEELDTFKRNQDDLGHSSREVQRKLDEMFPTAESMIKGYVKEQGGKVTVVAFDPKQADEIRAKLPDMDKPDNRILAIALQVKLTAGESEVIVVSRDTNVRLKARALGMPAEDLKRDKVDASEVQIKDTYPNLTIPESDINALYSTGELVLNTEEAVGFPLGYLTLTKAEKPDHQVPVKHLGDGRFRRLKGPKTIPILGGMNFKARNFGQQFMVDALYDDEVKLITAFGMAGTGKTLTALAAALNQVQSGSYNKVVITRSIVASSNDIGFLPGTAEEKMRPWVQSFYDAAELLMSRPKDPQFKDKAQSERKEKPKQQQKGGKPEVAPMKPHEKLLASGVLEIEVLAQIRGRSIPNVFFIADEVQNLSKREVKTLVTRMSEGTKLVLLGDPAQIDAPYMDKLSNGLVYVRSRMKGTKVHAHIDLIEGERSELAELAATLL